MTPLRMNYAPRPAPITFNFYLSTGAGYVRASIRDRANDQRTKRKGRRRLRPSEAWPVEARKARALRLEAVRVANSVSAPTGDWRRHREATGPYFAALEASVRLLCAGTCAWARARVLAHMAGDGEGLAYCTRGLHAAQATPRPPTWCEDVGEPPRCARPV